MRRVEAVTGNIFMRRVDNTDHLVHVAAEELKTNRAGLVERLDSFMAEMKELRQTIDRLKDTLLNGDVERFLLSAKQVGSFKVLTAVRNDLETGDLRKLGDFLRDRDENVIAVICSTANDKISFLAVCGKNAVAAGVKAGEIIKNVTAICGGKGGGKPDSAMGGGTDPLKIDDALATVDDYVASKIG